MTESTQDLWERYTGEVLRTTDTTSENEAIAMAGLGITGETAEVAEEIAQTGVLPLERISAGMMREAGGVADIIKKIIFHARPELRAKLINEIGDVFWYLALLMSVLGISLVEVLEANIAKLRKRYPDGFSAERSIHREDS